MTNFLELHKEQWGIIGDNFHSLVTALGIETKRIGKSTVCRCPNPDHEDAHWSAQIGDYCITCHAEGESWGASSLIELLYGSLNSKEKLRIGLKLCNLPIPSWLDYEGIGEYNPPSPKKKVVQKTPKVLTPAIQSLADRDRAYQNLRKQRQLLPDHLDNLRNRGLSDEQIEWGGYISVGRFEKLPGFANAPDAGFLCPVRQYGKVVGMQVRTASTEGKYRWVSNTYKPCQIEVTKSGEVEAPLSFLIGDRPDRPLLSEGFLKTDIIHFRTGRTCIGAAGGNHTAGKAQLLDYIQRFNPIGFDIFADAESIGNSAVCKKILRQISEYQELGLEVRVADYGQLLDKSLPSPDDWLVAGGDFGSIKWLSAEEFKAKCEDAGIEKESEKKAKINLQNWLKDKFLAMFHEPVVTNGSRKFILPATHIDLQFPQGGRLAAIEAAIASGKKYILDNSPTGTGKSYTAGEMIGLGAEHWGVSRLLFVTEDPRNITVPGLENVARIDSRHRGITLNESGERRIAKEGDDLVSPPSCFAPEIFAALRSAGIENADSSSIGCVGCPYFSECKSPASKFSTASKPSYIYQRRQGLGQSAMIVHPQSLPQPQGLSQDEKKFGYAKAQQGKDLGSLLYWEEFGKLQANQSIIVSQSDLERVFCQLNFNPIDFFNSNTDSAEFFNPIIKKLREIIEKDNSRFGISHQNIVKEFDIQSLRDTFSREQLKEIYDAIAPDLSFLKDSIDSIDSKGLSGSEAFSVRFAMTQEKIKQAEQLAKQWLHQFFGILIGERLGHFHIAHGQLRIDVYNPRIPQIATEAEINIFSDATLTRDRLAAMLRCKPEDIFVICQETDRPSNLKIKQIPIKSSLHRGADQTRRIEAAKAEIMARYPNEAIATIGSKGAGDQYYWFNHNRGTNAFYNQGIKHLILDGTPIQNIASLESEYHLLYGRIATPEELQQFTLEKCYTELTQALGRPRANLRPDEEITVWAITDIDLSPLGYPIEQVELGSLSLNCLGMVDRLKRKIGEAVKAGAETAQQIAEAVSKTQGRISQIAQQYGGFRPLMQILKSLLSDNNKEINNADLSPEALHTLAFEFLGIIGYEDTLLEGIAKAIHAYGQSKFEEAIAALKAVDYGYFEAIVEEIWVELVQIMDFDRGFFRAN